MQKPVPVPNKVASSCAMRSLVPSKRPAEKSTALTRIETLALGNCLLAKDRQNPALKQNYENAFELD